MKLSNVFTTQLYINPDNKDGRFYIIFTKSESTAELHNMLKGDIEIFFRLKGTVELSIKTQVDNLTYNTNNPIIGFEEALGQISKLELVVGTNSGHSMWPFSGQSYYPKCFQII